MTARRYLSPMALLVTACVIAVVAGMNVRTERFMTPETGVGYALGIVGGSLMLLLLLYPARKRARWLGFIGTVKGWFQFHMVLGLLGPLLILFHSNFQTGATNSNVALFCMLTVSLSGLVGRFFYSRIHVEFYGRQATLTELRENAARLQQVSTTIAFLPDLVQRLAIAESHVVQGAGRVPYVVRPLVVAGRAFLARRKLHKLIRIAARDMGLAERVPVAQVQRLRQTAYDFVDKRIDATKRVADFEAYEKLFSLWHVLHLPLFFMLLIAGTVHVIAVHVY